ncbi:MAG: Gfo/Idh/MocA family oxidoreductase [Gemmatimonadota bacterium]
MKIGVVDVDTSHPQNWIPIERDLGHEVVGLWDGGAVHPPAYVADFARQHQVPRVYDRLEDMVADVDCAIVHGCDWDSHVEKARPFVEAGKAVLLDKPMVGNMVDVQQLLDWAAAGKRVSGGSSLRFAAEVQAYLKEPMTDRGQVHTAFAGCGTDEFNYGIHAYALLSGLMGPGIRSVRYLGASRQKQLQVTWADGRIGYLCIGQGAWLPFHVTAVTEKAVRQITCDTKTLYRCLLEAVLPYLAGQVEEPPLPMAQLLEPELTALAARESWLRNGAEVFLGDLALEDEGYDGAVFAVGYRRQRYPKGS